jgi:PAS domain S-box-containing protein
MHQLPARVRALIVTVIVLGAGALALRAGEIAQWSSADTWIFVVLASAIVLFELFPLPLRQRTEILYLSLTDAIWTVGLILLLAGSADPKPGILTAAVAAGTLVGQALRRRAPIKVAFNVGQYLVAITLAEVLFASLHPLAASDPVTWLEAAAAMAACFALNAAATARVISWVEGESFLSVLVPPLLPNVMHWAGNLSLGILIAVTWEVRPAALPLTLIPLAVSYSAYRAWLRGTRERDVMRMLYEAGQSLLGPLEDAGFDRFLAVVRRLLLAEDAELVLIDGPNVTIVSGSGTATLTATDGAGAATAYVRVRDGVAPQVASIGGPDGPNGLLAVYRTEPLSDPDRSLLEALASQVRSRLLNQQLFREIAEQRAQLADVIAHTRDGIFTTSSTGSILSWNPGMTRVTGISTEDALGRRWHEVIESQTTSVSSMEGSGTTEDIVLRRTDDSERWVRAVRSPILDREGELTGEVVVARDVTAELEAERLKEDFLATVSPELRTPLTPLKGLVATLLAGIGDDSPEARQEYYRIMHRQAGRLEHLISDLLQVSAMDAGGLDVEPVPMDVGALLHEHVEEVRREHPERTVGLTEPDHAVVVQADPFRVGQVLSNLLSNAVKHSSEGTPIQVSVEADGPDAVLSVRNDGEGIHPADREQVFDRFFRGSASRSRQTGGAGLGLYIAKRLVEAMGGSIWLASDEGTTFSFRLPLVSAVPGHAPLVLATASSDRASRD